MHQASNSPADAREATALRASDLELRVRGELLKLVYNDQPRSLAAALVYAAAVAAVLARFVNTAGPWFWLAGMVATILGRYALAVAYRHAEPAPRDHARWERRFFVGALVMGLLWGASGWFFHPFVPTNYGVLVIMVLGGIAAAASRSIVSQLAAFAAFATAAVLPLAVRLLLEGTPRSAFMAGFLVIFLLFMTAAARTFRNTIARSFRLGFENADLAATLTDDIAARRAAEAALRASEEQLRFALYALDHAQDLVAIVGRAGDVLYVNEAFCRFTGRTQRELREGRAWLCYAAIDQARFEALWDEARRAGITTFESEIIAGSGERKPVEVNASFLEFDGRAAVCAVSRDLTGRRAAELEKSRLQLQLQETQKLESLGVLAGGIAHDFNNLLTAILGNATLARESLARPLDLREMLTQIERAGNQAAGLCRQMLAYAGKGRFVVEPVELTALVADSSKLLEMTIAHRAGLELRLASGLPSVMADASQMRQIVMNLVHNAAEAIHDPDGEILISTSRVWIDRALVRSARVAADVPDGEGVCLEVRDNGSGMDRPTLERIFEPFFTTKFTGRGLGLAAVLGIVRSHQGLLQVQSEVGRGTIFRLVFPALPVPARTASNSPIPRTDHVRDAGRALVVDDEDTVRNISRQMLERIGFTVETVEDGESALALVAREPERFRLILLDLTMPRLDGVMTLGEMRRLGARACIVLMSGFSEQQARERLGPLDVSGFLQKPFDLPALRQKIDPVLTGHAVEAEMP